MCVCARARCVCVCVCACVLVKALCGRAACARVGGRLFVALRVVFVWSAGTGVSSALVSRGGALCCGVIAWSKCVGGCVYTCMCVRVREGGGACVGGCMGGPVDGWVSA